MLTVHIPEAQLGKEHQFDNVFVNLNDVLASTAEKGVYGTPGYRPDLHEFVLNKIFRDVGLPEMDHAVYAEEFQGKPSYEKFEMLGVPKVATDAQLAALGVPSDQYEQNRDLWKVLAEEKTKRTVEVLLDPKSGYLTPQEIQAIHGRVEAAKAITGNVWILTNSDGDSAIAIAEMAGLGDRIKGIITKDDMIIDPQTGERRKVKPLPAPEMLEHALAVAGAKLESSVFIGNAGKSADALVAQGLPVITVSGPEAITLDGMRKARVLLEAGKEGVISTTAPELLNQIIPAELSVLQEANKLANNVLDFVGIQTDNAKMSQAYVEAKTPEARSNALQQFPELKVAYDAQALYKQELAGVLSNRELTLNDAKRDLSSLHDLERAFVKSMAENIKHGNLSPVAENISAIQIVANISYEPHSVR